MYIHNHAINDGTFVTDDDDDDDDEQHIPWNRVTITESGPSLLWWSVLVCSSFST